MSDHEMTTPSGQDREGAAAAMRDLPGETALGHVDQASVDKPVSFDTPIAEAAAEAGFTPDVSRQRDGDPGAASQDATGGLQPLDELDRSGTDQATGDLSTGGDAAREALGVDPREAAGGEIPDRSTGEATHDEVAGG